MASPSTPIDSAPLVDARREPREEIVRIVEYTPFPRQSPDERPRLGFTRDLSRHGMCLGVDDPEEAGRLVRLDVRALDGGSSDTAIGRVAWCGEARDGRYWIGLELVHRDSAHTGVTRLS